MGKPTKFAVGNRWRCSGERRCGQLDFVIVGPGDYGEPAKHKSCRLEVEGHMEKCCPSCHHGIVQTYSHKHLKKYAQLVSGGQPRSYAFKGIPGCVLQSRSRYTGTLISIYRTQDLPLSNASKRFNFDWFVVCEDHDQSLPMPTLNQAKEKVPCSNEWCSSCFTKINEVVGAWTAFLKHNAAPETSLDPQTETK